MTLRLRCACLAVALLFRVSSAAQDKPLSADDLEKSAKFIVQGRVERVYTSEKIISATETDTLYAIELVVSKVTKVDAAGKTISVMTWSPRSPASPPLLVGLLVFAGLPGKGPSSCCSS